MTHPCSYSHLLSTLETFPGENQTEAWNNSKFWLKRRSILCYESSLGTVQKYKINSQQRSCHSFYQRELVPSQMGENAQRDYEQHFILIIPKWLTYSARKIKPTGRSSAYKYFISPLCSFCEQCTTRTMNNKWWIVHAIEILLSLSIHKMQWQSNKYNSTSTTRNRASPSFFTRMN